MGDGTGVVWVGRDSVGSRGRGVDGRWEVAPVGPRKSVVPSGSARLSTGSGPHWSLVEKSEDRGGAVRARPVTSGPVYRRHNRLSDRLYPTPHVPSED